MADGSVKIDIVADDSDIKKKLNEIEDKAEDAADKLDDLGDSSQKSGKGFDVASVAIGNFISGGIQNLIGKVGEAISSLVALADETREYREDMAKLNTAFKSAGHSTETAQKAYDEFYKILGESDRSVEAVNHLAELTKNEKDVAKWGTIAAGVTAKFGDSLPLEGLTEAANETAKVGQTTGVLADALNWASADSTVFADALGGNKKAMAAFNQALKEGENVEDAFSAALSKMSTEQERSAAITNTLNGLYSEAAAEYNEMTAGAQAAREATNRMEQAQAKLGAAMEPVTTAWTNIKAGMLEWVAESFTAKESTDVLTESQRASVTAANEAADAYRATKDAAYELALAQMADVNYATTTLLPQLQALVDANGRVKQGYEERAAFLLGQFNEAMGTEYTRISEIIGKNGELKQSILDTIEAKKAQILLAPLEESYKNAVLNVAEAEKTRAEQALVLAQQTDKVAQAERAYKDLQAEVAEAVKTKGADAARAYADRAKSASLSVDSEKANLKALQDEYALTETNLQGYYNDINSYQTASTLLMQGKTEEAVGYLNNLSAGYDSSASAAEDAANRDKKAVEDRLINAAIKLALLEEERKSSEENMTEAQKTEMQNRITEAKKEVEALGTEAKNLGSNLVEGIGKGADEKSGWLSGKLGGIVSAAIEAAKKVGIIKSPSRKTRDEIGKPLVEGIGVGIDKNSRIATKAMGNLVDDVIDAAKEEAEIHSPSRVMQDDVGSMLVRGLELGIRKTSNVAIDAMKDLGTALIDEAIKAAEESSEAFEEATTKTTTKSTSSSTSNSTSDSTKKYNEFVKPSATNPDLVMSNDERAQALGYPDFRTLQEKEYKIMTRDHNIFQVVADTEEEARRMWEAFMLYATKEGGARIGSQELWSPAGEDGVRDLLDKRIGIEDNNGKLLYSRQQLVPEEIKEQAKEQAKQTEAANKKLLGDYKSYNEAIEKLGIDGAAKLIANNKKLIESEVKTGSERVEQLKEFKSNYERTLSDINKLEEDYAANSLRIQEQLNNDIQRVVEDYQNSFESKAEGIVNSLSLFEKAEKADTASGTEMVIALRSQVRVLEDYKTALDELSKRDVNPAFIEEMSNLGVDALPQLKAFNKMSEAQLNEYVALWENKSNLANEATEIALAQKRERTKQEIQALKDAANEESAILYMEYNTAMFDLLEQVSTGMQEIGDAGLQALGEHIQGYVDMGKQLMAGVAEGLAQNGHLVGDELVGSVKSAMSKVKDEMGIHSPSTVTRDEIGKNLADGVAVGWSEKLNAVKGKMSADMRAITDRIKTAVSLEQERMAQGIGVRDTGFSEVAQAVGMQTAGINSLASEYRRGSNAQVTVPLVIDGRELGRAIVDLGNAETVRTGTSLSFA